MESRTSRVRVARHLGYIVLAAVSCRDSVGPDARNTRLSAASPTQLTGTVGTPVADPPSVTVRDASGKVVAGVAVTFSVRSGGGTIQTPRVVSNSAGLARVAEWTLGTATGLNAIVATNASGDTVKSSNSVRAAAPSSFLENSNFINVPPISYHITKIYGASRTFCSVGYYDSVAIRLPRCQMLTRRKVLPHDSRMLRRA